MMMKRMTKGGKQKQKQDWSAHSLSTALAPAVPSALEQAGLQHKYDDDNHDDQDDQGDDHDDQDDNHDLIRYG